MPLFALIPGTARIDLAIFALTVEVVEELIDETRSRRNAADVNGGFPMLSSAAANAFIWVISRVIRNCSASLVPGSSAEIDQALIDDLGPGFRRDVAAQVDVEFAGDLQIVGGPGVALRVEQIHAAAAGNGDQRIGFGRLAIEFHRLEMHAREACRRSRDG